MKKPPVISRILATIFDFVLVAALCLVSLIPAIISLVNTLISNNNLNITALFISAFFGGGLTIVIIIVYSIVLPVYWNGQTLGKRFFFMQTIKQNGDQVDFKCMFIRVMFHVFMIFATFGVSIFVDFITLCFSKRHVTFYDILASTCVKDVIE